MSKLIAVLVAAFAAVGFASSALAGGWSVVTLDALPRGVAPHQEVQLGFMVRQHGQTPLSNLTPTVTLVNPATGEQVTASATGTGEPGHYTADFVLPSAGSWAWSIDVFEGKHRMPALDVRPSGAAAAILPGGRSRQTLQLGRGLVAGAATLGALSLAVDGRRRVRTQATAPHGWFSGGGRKTSSDGEAARRRPSA